MSSHMPIAGCLLPYFTRTKEDTSDQTIKVLFKAEDIAQMGQVILQVKEATTESKEGKTYYKTFFSDTKHIFPAVFFTLLEKNSIVKLTGFQIHKQKGFLTNATHITLSVSTSLIGHPTSFNYHHFLTNTTTTTTTSNSNNNNHRNPPTTPTKLTLDTKTLPKTQAPYEVESQDLQQQLPNFGIRDLTQNAQEWTIEAIVKSKGSIKTWSKPTSNGQLISFELSDATGDIKATAFNEVCRSLHNYFEEGKVYRIQGGHLKAADPKFNKTGHPCELSFGNATKALLIENSNVKISYQATPIAEIAALEEKNTVDVIAVVQSTEPQREMVIKGRDTKKRSITIMDSTNASIGVTFWGIACDKLKDLKTGDIIAIKSAQISNYNSKSLNCGENTHFEINQLAGMQPARDLNQWYQENKKDIEASDLIKNLSISSGTGFKPSQLSTISNLKLIDSTHVVQNPGETFSLHCYFNRIKTMVIDDPSSTNTSKWFYFACSNCKKTKTDEGECTGTDFKTKAPCTNTEKGVPQYKLNVKLQDQESECFAEIMGEVGTKFFEQTAQQLLDMGSGVDPFVNEKYSRMYKVTVKTSEYQGAVRFNVVKIEEPSYDILIENELDELNVSKLLIQKLL